MSGTKQIHDYTAANSIDAVADYFLIDPQSTGIYKKINRNTVLGLASAPLGLTDIQSPQNKVFDNTNSLAVKDNSLTIQSSSGTTKQAVFSASGITAGQTRTFTFPDASGTLATIAGTQTLTNKTLTSPTITGGTIDNSTITVDSISGHTVATTVTVGNLQIANGVLNTANSVTATAVAAGAIQPQALVSGTGAGWAWQSWTPVWTNLTPGNAVNSSSYIQIGKTVIAKLFITLGNTSSVGTSPIFTLPVTCVSSMGADVWMGTGRMAQPGVGNAGMIARFASTTTGSLVAMTANGTYVGEGIVTATAPFTWASTGYIQIVLIYEAA